MSITTTAHFSWTVDNTTGTVGYKVKYRLAGTTPWTSYDTSGTTTSVAGLATNSIYDFQVINVNNNDNPPSLVTQAINITDPLPLFSITDNSISYSFIHPTSYITSYTTTIALATDPGNILYTLHPGLAPTITGTFSGLSAATDYVIGINVTADQFNTLFTYPTTTGPVGNKCAVPLNVNGVLVSGGTELDVTWTAPVPAPGFGYVLNYREKGAPYYSTYYTSGTTYTATLPVPACYEGYVTSFCVDHQSTPVPFGGNAYQPLTVSVTVSGTTATGIATSDYPNPYDILGQVTVYYHVGMTPGVYVATGTYPAGSTSIVFFNSVIPGVIIDSYTVDYLTPVFNNGGGLQQFDPVNTPQYFNLYWVGNTSGTTWNGDPCTLPSFTLDQFIVTDLDTSGNTIGGDLHMSWAYGDKFNGGAAPYDYITFSIYDPADSSLLGTGTIDATVLGLRTAIVHLTKTISPIDLSTEFNMKTTGSDTVQIGSTIPFYLPTF